MPQLDIMTFYIQGFSIFLTILVLYYFFYVVLLPLFTINLFLRLYLQRFFFREFKNVKLRNRKIFIRLIISLNLFLLTLKDLIMTYFSFFLESLRLKKEKVFIDFLSEHSDDILILLHQLDIEL